MAKHGKAKNVARWKKNILKTLRIQCKIRPGDNNKIANGGCA